MEGPEIDTWTNETAENNTSKDTGIYFRIYQLVQVECISNSDISVNSVIFWLQFDLVGVIFFCEQYFKTNTYWSSLL